MTHDFYQRFVNNDIADDTYDITGYYSEHTNIYNRAEQHLQDDYDTSFTHYKKGYGSKGTQIERLDENELIKISKWISGQDTISLQKISSISADVSTAMERELHQLRFILVFLILQ